MGPDGDDAESEIIESTEVKPVAVLSTTLVRKVTFASHQNDVPVILDLVIENPSANDLEDLTLTIVSEPEVFRERAWKIDRIGAGSKVRIADTRLPLSGGLLDQLTERLRADVILSLVQSGDVIVEERRPIEALARNEWGGSRFMPELLAAFVVPNDPFVQQILKETSGILKGAGRERSIDGYQKQSSKRVWEVMSAIWAAIVGRGLTYAVPPASFETTGQKVRMPSDIERDGLATCLDTALLFAAAFEQAGFHPVIVFTKGHAFAGAWLQPSYFPTLTVDDPIVVRSAMKLRELVLFETTMATAGHALPFSKAIADAERQMEEANEEAFVYALDVRQARRSGVQPLSSTIQGGRPGGGGATGAVAIPALDPLPDDLPDLPQPEETDLAERTPEERLAAWKRSLLDLSKRNRLLSLRAAASAIPIFCPDPGRLEDLLAGGARLRLIPPPERGPASAAIDPTLFRLRTGDDWSQNFAIEALERKELVANTDRKTLEKGAIELYRKARADMEEGGSNTLFLALGMLRWSPTGGAGSYRAPMILMPVRLERASAVSKPVLTRHEDETVFNLTLLQMLRQDFAIEMPELAGELPRDASGVDVKRIWDTVRIRIRNVPGFEVVEDVVLSTFSFAKYLMWKDLADRADRLKEAPVVRHLIDTPRQPYRDGAEFVLAREIDRRIGPSDVCAPLNADSSQLVAIHASGGDADFVLEGPPGTGKSETIGNIIAHNLALGRRVLFVSEKMAALEVVYRRLSEIGLGDFCLELHSNKASKKAVLDQLDAAWSSREEHDPDEWRRQAAALASLRERLNGLVDALHAPGPAGVSTRDAIGRVLRYGDLHRIALDWPKHLGPVGRAGSREAFDDLCDAAHRLGQAFGQIKPGDFEVFSSVRHDDWSFAWQSRLLDAARTLRRAAEETLAARDDLCDRLGLTAASSSLREAEALANLSTIFSICEEIDLGFALSPDGKRTIESLESLSDELRGYRELRSAAPSGYRDEAIRTAPLALWIEERERAKAKSFLFRGGALKKLQSAMVASIGPGGANPENDLELLKRLADQLNRITDLEAMLPAEAPWAGGRTDLSRLDRGIDAARRLREAVLRLSDAGQDLVSLRSALKKCLCDGRDLLSAGSAIDRAGARLRNALTDLRSAMGQWHDLAGQGGDGESEVNLASIATLAEGVIERERRLNPWCGWVAARREAEEKGLSALASALEEGLLSHEEAAEAFRTAYCRWAAPELIDANPILRGFSATAHGSSIESFRKLDAEFAGLTARYVRATLSGSVPDRSLTADPGLGVLARQLQRGAQSMPVRRLVSEMGPSLTTLTPCLMMSPLSVAQFLPADSALFDLVVFDEASQITVPDAIGAIARGRRCIIVGDPKQMPPTSFFSRGADDDEGGGGHFEPDLESILDEALAARVPLHRLTGHYRSRHESLIAFSNHAYYDGHLVTYPSADTRETAVRLVRVDGVYARGRERTNPKEAQAVAKAIVEHLSDPERNHLSIGVVTMNAEQQRLIENLLDDERRARPALEKFFGPDAREPVFVKNLETVQGDQRDVILISVCYGPTEPGAATMSMSFGPLNRQGGQRRLNVAITRATTEVAIFCSFDPGMIDLTRTQAEAVRDLKRYLEFAAQGPTALGRAVRSIGTNDYDSDFEMAVAEGLRRYGWSVRTQIGVSKFRIDLGVVHPDAPGQFLAGVECDGAAYHSSPSARDRDRVRHIILERLGWRLLRVWSTDWFLDPEARLQRLHDELQAVLLADRSEAEAKAARMAETDAARTDRSAASIEAEAPIEPDDIMSDPTLPVGGAPPPDRGDEVSTIVPTRATTTAATSTEAAAPVTSPLPGLGDSQAQPDIAVDPDNFHAPSYRTTLQRLARLYVEEEGPITYKRVSDLIAREHGFQRTGSQISSTIWHAVERVARRTRSADEHWIFWPDGMEPAGIVEFRGLTIAGRSRSWKEVPLPERLGLVRQVQATSPSDLGRAVAETIGYGRVTQSFRDEIDGLAAQID